ncbi:MAG TPA: 16S rRNA pseudouridine(516) synthase [Bacilli bacterium]|nr:16S rRNA pseudouridine(516) synthase [Bacilli bacterium]
MRLDKYIAKSLGITRSEAVVLIKRKQIRVNDRVVVQKDYDVEANIDCITYNNQELHYLDRIYIMMNKPAGYVSANKDQLHPTVFDLIDGFPKQDLFIVGRLDIDVTGLLLITNDGALSHQYTNPKHHVVKQYVATLSHELTPDQIKEFEAGIVIKDGFGEPFQTKQASLQLDEENPTIAYVEISEGKYHQVKRMFAYFGVSVLALKRLRINKLSLDKQLAQGEYRLLTEEEIELLRQ